MALLTRDSARPRAPKLITLSTGDECYIRTGMTGRQLIEYREQMRELEQSVDREAPDYDANIHGMRITAIAAAHYACDEAGNLIFAGMTADELLADVDFRILDEIWAAAIEQQQVTLDDAEKKS